MTGPGAAPDALVRRAHDGDPRALARLVSLIENGADGLRSVMAELAPLTGRAHVIGLTGAPGAGKSTVTSALVGAYRGRGLRVAVLAVDPTSPFTGGALLGDRVRMQEHATDSGVFIRSMASRGHVGGLAAAAPQVIRALDAARFDVVLIETVGVGQVEVEIAAAADSVVVLVVPGMGDAVQAAKAGILEIADVFAVNKADRPQAQETVRDLRGMIALADRAEGEWKPPIVSTVAIQGEGIGELAGRLDQHWSWLGSSGERERRRIARAREEIAALAMGVLRGKMARLPGGSALGPLAARVATGETDPYSAADELLSALGTGPGSTGPGGSAPGDEARGSGVPRDGVPGSGVPRDGASGGGAPGSGVPRDGASGGGVPGDRTAGGAGPGGGAPGWSAPGEESQAGAPA